MSIRGNIPRLGREKPRLKKTPDLVAYGAVLSACEKGERSEEVHGTADGFRGFGVEGLGFGTGPVSDP